MKLTKVWAFASVVATLLIKASSAQTVAHPVTDSKKIADALSADPPFITKDATILDWPSNSRAPITVFFSKARTNGLASLLCPAIRMTSRGVSTEFLCSG